MKQGTSAWRSIWRPRGTIISVSGKAFISLWLPETWVRGDLTRGCSQLDAESDSHRRSSASSHVRASVRYSSCACVCFCDRTEGWMHQRPAGDTHTHLHGMLVSTGLKILIFKNQPLCVIVSKNETKWMFS